MSRAGRRRALVVVAALVVAASGVIAYVNRPAPLPPVNAQPVELVKFCTTDAFANLPESKKYAYVEALINQGIVVIIAAADEAKLTEAERQRGLENAMQAGIQYRMGKHLDEWLKLDEAGKREYVKKVAAESRPRLGIAAPGNNSSRGGRFMTPDRQKRFIES